MDSERLLTSKEVAKRLGIKTQTLAAWRTRQSQNLPYIRIGRLVRYRLEDIKAFESRYRYDH